MARYGTIPYGTFPYGSVPVSDRVVTNVAVRRGLEGPQIILTWNKPSDYINVTKLRVVRKMGSFPENISDGKNVFETTDINIETFTDFPEYGPEFFYYKIFTEHSGSWASNRLNEVVELSLDTTSELQDKFFRELPEIYRAFDKKRFGSKQFALIKRNLDPYEKVCLAEDGTKDFGELQRFLRLFNLFFNEALSMIRAISTRDGLGIIHDIFRTSPFGLSQISALYGWDFNWDLPVMSARKEVLSLPEIYRKKGRTDTTTELIEGILTGHSVTIFPMDEVVDLNQYPNGFLNTKGIIGSVNFLTIQNDIYVFADINDNSSIGLNKVVINILPGAAIKLKASHIVKLENILDDFFNILEDVYIIVHETFNLTYPTDFTTVGQAFMTPYLPLPNPAALLAFGHYGIGSGYTIWDETSTPSVPVSSTRLKNEKFREIPRNIVFLDGSGNPTTTPTKLILVRCFMDLETFTGLYSREAGQFANDSGSVKDSGTLLFAKTFPVRFVDDRVRYVVDFKIQFP